MSVLEELQDGSGAVSEATCRSSGHGTVAADAGVQTETSLGVFGVGAADVVSSSTSFLGTRVGLPE